MQTHFNRRHAHSEFVRAMSGLWFDNRKNLWHLVVLVEAVARSHNTEEWVQAMNSLEEKLQNMHLLSRQERIELTDELKRFKPPFLKPYVPKWWWWSSCKVKVLIVCDGGLNFGTGGFDLSEFLTAFNELESRTWVNYEVTLAHRGSITNSSNPVVVNHIGNFDFDSSANLNSFDQIWLFGINSSGDITPAEVNAIQAFMDGGGGLFATGDHGALGNAMSGSIPRVKDMRYWADTSASNDTNEVSMQGKRRNDTNKPRPGNAVADTFDHQSDNIPQTIAVRTFASGHPHPLLSISPSLRPSGVIDIMPDHPHEGECKHETSFTVNGIAVPTQVIATSFVNGGNTSGGKDATDPHCFPSISVWDGWVASAGRIVIDSTWHHFVNINLNGAGSAQTGLSNSDFEVVRQYYMNIATWMSRRKFMLCLRPRVVYELFKGSQLIESTLNYPTQRLEDVSLADLNSIGVLAEEILSAKFSPSFARNFLIELMRDLREDFADTVDVWKPHIPNDTANGYHENWINYDLLLHTSVGAGFIALRDDDDIASDDAEESAITKINKVFPAGMKYGFEKSAADLMDRFKNIRDRLS